MSSLALLMMMACGRAPERRVVVMGIDGLEWSMVDRLVEAGEMPQLAGLMERGVRGVVQNTTPVMSPIIWTTIASGYPGEVHGIAGWTTGRGHGYNAADVRVMRLWDIATREGVESLVVGWLMTFPASPIQGRMISDRYVWSFPMNKDPGDPSLLVDRAMHEGLAGLVTPPSLEATLAPWLPDEAWLSAHPLAYQVEEYGSPFHPLRRDELHLRAFEQLWPDGDASLGMLYLNGPDQVSHIYWPYADPQIATQIRRSPQEHLRQVNAERGPQNTRRAAPFSEAPITPEQLELGARFVPDYYRYIDEAIGRVLEVVDLDDTTLLICSDHGFRPSPSHPLANGGHTREGAVLFVGEGVDPEGQLRDGASVLDLGPTLFALLDLPGAEDWPGAPLVEVFDGLEAAPPDASHVLTDRAQIAVELGTEANPQLMEQLEALGYVDGAGKPILGASRGSGQ
ncbi:MAG: alkaline phosphatase family protein [Alphaproteobacteria bacterium]|nr:alkaline phosphatase family protein [Alphaproteobacteria bacterium]